MGKDGKREMDEKKAELLLLLRDSTAFYEAGFSVDLKKAPARWHALVKALGARESCALMAADLCERYRQLYGRDFLFSEKCVAFELWYHLAAYLWAAGFPDHRRHISTYLFSRKKLMLHCQEIDISTDDAASLRQRVMFGYRKGVRPVYRSTGSDPFRRR